MLHPVEQRFIDAVWEDDFDTISALFMRYGNKLDPNFSDEHGDTPLMLSTDLVITRTLLDYGADPNVKDEYDRNVLHVSISEGDLDKVKLLISFGADLNIKTSDGRNMLQYALSHKQNDIVRYIQAHIKESVQKTHFEKAVKNPATQYNGAVTQTHQRQKNINHLKKATPCHPSPRKRPTPKGRGR